MTSYGGDSPIGRVLSRVMLCACQALTDAGRRPCVCSLYWGSTPPVMDEYCGCDCGDHTEGPGVGGRLWTRFVRMDPLSRDLEVERCAPMQVMASIEVGVFRCWPMAEQGLTAAADDLNRAALGLMTDNSLIWSSIACCANVDNRSDWINDWEVTPYASQPVVTQGGCSGTWVMAYVRGVLPGSDVLAQMAKAGP